MSVFTKLVILIDYFLRKLQRYIQKQHTSEYYQIDHKNHEDNKIDRKRTELKKLVDDDKSNNLDLYIQLEDAIRRGDFEAVDKISAIICDEEVVDD